MTYLIFTIVYVLISVSVMRIAKRVGLPRPWWFAWIPVLQELVVVWTARKRWWWILLFLIPLVNLWATWIVWGAIARQIGRSAWWGRAMIVPFLNFFILLVLAFSWEPQRWVAAGARWAGPRVRRLAQRLTKRRDRTAEL